VDVPKLLQDRSKPAEFAVMERTRIANCTNEFRPELSFVSSLRYKIKHVQIRSLTGSDRSDRFRRFKRSATDLTFFGQGSLTLTTLIRFAVSCQGRGPVCVGLGSKSGPDRVGRYRPPNLVWGMK
jgi:hypothetical protein